MTANAQVLKPKTINITFGGRGESTVVDEVTVENLSRPSSLTATVTLSGSDILKLTNVADDANGIESVQEAITRPIVYPSPAYGDGTLVFDAPKEGEISVRLVNASGVVMSSSKFYVKKGRHTVTLPAQTTGFYAVSIVGAGMKNSVKWMSAGTSRSFSGMALDRVATNRQLPLVTLATRAESNVNQVAMYYEEGDVLRFTGSSGKMRTIVMNSPTCDHDIMFDFYKCEDANGYNYTVVRAGDMLWMTEDLHPLQGQSWLTSLDSDSKQHWNIIDPNTPMQIEIDGVAYFNRPAALRALPAGWNLPTAGEVDYLIQALGGAKHAGDKIKDHSAKWMNSLNDIDSVSFGGRALGYIVTDAEQGAKLVNKGLTGAWLLRNTVERGCLATYEIDATKSEFMNNIGGKGTKNFGFTIRGMRHVASPYHQMLKKFAIDNPEMPANSKPRVAKAPMQFVDKGPLGQYYKMSSSRTSLWYNFTGNQWKTADMERRTGEFYKINGKWNLTNKEAMPVRTIAQGGDNVLRKMVAQENQRGYQNMVYAEWSRPFHLWLDPTHKNEYVWGDGYVNLWIYGDVSNNFAYTNATLKDKSGNNYKFTIPNLEKLSWLRYNSIRITESRYDYTLRCFNIKCIQDLTGDNIDEIVMNVGEKVAIFDGASFKLIKEVNYKQVNQTFMGHCSVRIEVGDVDSDGREDLVVLVADGSTFCHLKIYLNGDIESAPAYDIVVPSYGFLNDVKVGSCCGMQYPEIAVLTRAMSADNINLERVARLSMYRLKGDSNGKVTGYESVIQATGIDGFSDGNNGNYGGHVGNCQLTFAYLRGHNYNADLIVADGLWRADNGQTAPTYRFNPLDFTKCSQWSIFADCIVANDQFGSGKDNLMFFKSWNTGDNDTEDRMYIAQLNEIYCTNGEKFDSNNDRGIATTFNTGFMKYSDNGAYVFSDQKDSELLWWHNRKGNGNQRCSNATLASVRSREKAKFFEYESYERTYAEPRIYALLAAAPYFEGYNEPGETTWGYGRSQTHETVNTDQFNSSVILGYNFEFNAPIVGTKVGEVDFTAKINGEWGISSSQSTSKEYGEYHTATEQDRVILHLRPYDTYTYRIAQSDNPDDLGGLITISMPLERRFMGITLDDYNRLVADQKGVPQLNKLFTHTPGDPFTYPNDESYFKSNVEGGKVMWCRGFEDKEGLAEVGSGGKTTRTIKLEEASGTGSSSTYGFEVELVATVGSVKAGAGFGYGNTNENNHTVASSHEVSATVSGIKDYLNDVDKIFTWNLCWFDYELNKQKFPVLHYIVKKRK